MNSLVDYQWLISPAAEPWLAIEPNDPHRLLARLRKDLSADRAHLMADLIRRQIAQVGRDTIVEISVAQDDFSSDEAVAEVDRNISIVRADLPAGSCRIKLEMGEIDAGLPHQWAMLRNMLAQSGEEELRRAG